MYVQQRHDNYKIIHKIICKQCSIVHSLFSQCLFVILATNNTNNVQG